MKTGCGDYGCLVGKACRGTQGKCGTLDDKTDLAVSHLFGDCARELDSRSYSGVFVDMKPGAESTEDIAESVLNTSHCLLFVVYTNNII